MKRMQISNIRFKASLSRKKSLEKAQSHEWQEQQQLRQWEQYV